VAARNDPVRVAGIKPLPVVSEPYLEVLYRLRVPVPLVLASDNIGTRIVGHFCTGAFTVNHPGTSQITLSLAKTASVGGQLPDPYGVARSTGAMARSGEEIGRATTDFTARSDITTGRSRSMRPHTTCSPSGIRSGSRQKASLTNRLNRSGGSNVARGSAFTVLATVCSRGVPARSSSPVTS
jgi:hypothetical protein